MSDEFSRRLKEIARNLDALLTIENGERMGFVLMCVPFNKETSQVQYASNCCREHAKEMMQDLLKRWEEGQPDIPHHERH